MDADLHNFGRKTQLTTSSKIIKFRSLSGEYLFFGEHSTVRTLLNQLYQTIAPGSILLPQLGFSFNTFNSGLSPQEMEYLKLTPAQELSRDDCLQIGAYLAVSLALGLTDCHQGNLLMGRLRDGVFTFVSVDCETVLTDMSEPGASGFFRLKSSCPCPGPYCRSFGLGILQNFPQHSQKIMAASVLSGFQGMLRLLIDHHSNVAAAVCEFLRSHQLVRRVLLNSTFKYAQAIAAADFSGFCPEEQEQLERGEIPYFFQIHGEAEVYYWQSHTECTPLYPRPQASELPGLESREKLASLRSKVIPLITRSLDFWPEANYSSHSGELSITYKRDHILYPLEGELLAVRRQLP